MIIYLQLIQVTLHNEAIGMKNLFERTSSNWVQYDNYEWKKGKKGSLYLTPVSVAKPDIYDPLSEDSRRLMQQGMAAFGGNAPTYHIALLDKPTIIWDFHSLSLGIQMMFSFMLADDAKPMRMCRHCTKVFVANRPSSQFCSPQCKNKYNVYKSRAKDKKEWRTEHRYRSGTY